MSWYSVTFPPSRECFKKHFEAHKAYAIALGGIPDEFGFEGMFFFDNRKNAKTFQLYMEVFSDRANQVYYKKEDQEMIMKQRLDLMEELENA